MFSLDIGIHHVDDGLVVINIPHLHLDFIQPCKLRCMKAPVPGDDFIATLGAGAHGQVCKYAVFLDLTPKMYPKIVYFLPKMYPKGIFA